MGKGSGGAALVYLPRWPRAHGGLPGALAILDEYYKPVVVQDEVLGELTLNKDYDTFEGEIQWCGKM